MCLACAAIEDELAEQEMAEHEQSLRQTKLPSVHEVAILTDTVASDEEQQP